MTTTATILSVLPGASVRETGEGLEVGGFSEPPAEAQRKLREAGLKTRDVWGATVVTPRGEQEMGTEQMNLTAAQIATIDTHFEGQPVITDGLLVWIDDHRTGTWSRVDFRGKVYPTTTGKASNLTYKPIHWIRSD